MCFERATETDTNRDRQRQTETDRDRQRQTETDRDRQRQKRQTDGDRHRVKVLNQLRGYAHLKLRNCSTVSQLFTMNKQKGTDE